MTGAGAGEGNTDASRGLRAGSVTVLLRGGLPQWITDILWGLVWGYFLVGSWGGYVFPFVGWPGRSVLIGLFACVSLAATAVQRRGIPLLTVTPARLRLCEGRHESRLSRIWREIDRQQVESVHLEWHPSTAKQELSEHGTLSIRCHDGQEYRVIDVSSRRCLRRAGRVLKHYDWPVSSGPADF